MYARNGMPDLGGYGDEGVTLTLNGTHPLVEYLADAPDDKKAELVCAQLYDLAKIAHAPLKPEEMEQFIRRSNEILLETAKTGAK